jgi:hypothetical protein
METAPNLATQAATVNPRAAAPPKLREAAFSDYEQIAALETRYGLAAKSFPDWSRLWLENPLYEELQKVWPIGWVLESADGKIVGSMGNIPLQYELGGKRIVASSGRAWVAEPAYRSFSLALLDRVVNQRVADVHLNNSLTSDSYDSAALVGCHRVPAGCWNRTAFWITGYHRFFKSYAAMMRPWLAPFAWPLASAAFCRDRLREKKLPGGADVQPYAEFTTAFDDFWAQLRQKRPHMLLAVRSSHVLEWHFRESLRAGKLWIGAIHDGPRIAAYAVFDRKDNERVGLKRVRLVDYQSLDGSTALLGSILTWALRRCRAEGIHSLECLGRWLEPGELMADYAPYLRTLTAWVYLYHVGNRALAAALSRRDAWDPSLYDGNASL